MFNLKRIVDFLFILIVFITTRQFPFSFLSPIMNAALVLMIIISVFMGKMSLENKNLILVFLMLPLFANFIYSLALTDNNPGLALRFLIILISIGLAYFIEVGPKALRWFIYLCLIQAFILIIIEIYISVFVGYENYLPIRFFFQEKGWGDVYTYNGVFYRIQIKGNALILIALILTIETDLIRLKKVACCLLVIGIIFAGNFAFIISGFLYLAYVMFRFKGKFSILKYQLVLSVFTILLIVLSPYIYNYVSSTLLLKQDDSLGARYDQVTELLNNLFSTIFTLFLGQGLGNTLNVKTSFRDYTGLSYYELQVVYVFNQLGILFSALFLNFNVLMVLKRWGQSNYVLMIYLIYISYSITNPYILDTNHFIVIVVLNSLIRYDRDKRTNRDTGDYHLVQS